MQKSDSIKEIARALAIVQGKLVTIKNNAENPHFKFKYADLAAIVEAVRKPLSEAGLAVIQDATTEGKNVTITTLLAHTTGEWISTELKMESESTLPQKIGSTITYGRRYSLSALVGVATEDDDGQLASQTNGTAKPAAKAPTATTAKPATAPKAATGAAPAQAAAPSTSAAVGKAKEIFNAKSTTGAETKTEPTSLADQRKEIMAMVLEMSFGDAQAAGDLLSKLGDWKTKDENGNEKIVKGKRDAAAMSDKAVPVCRRIVKKEYDTWLAANGPSELDAEYGNGEVVE